MDCQSRAVTHLSPSTHRPNRRLPASQRILWRCRVRQRIVPFFGFGLFPFFWFIVLSFLALGMLFNLFPFFTAVRRIIARIAAELPGNQFFGAAAFASESFLFFGFGGAHRGSIDLFPVGIAEGEQTVFQDDS